MQKDERNDICFLELGSESTLLDENFHIIQEFTS